jgi:hypothetical protein
MTVANLWFICFCFYFCQINEGIVWDRLYQNLYVQYIFCTFDCISFMFSCIFYMFISHTANYIFIHLTIFLICLTTPFVCLTMSFSSSEEALQSPDIHFSASRWYHRLRFMRLMRTYECSVDVQCWETHWAKGCHVAWRWLPPTINRFTFIFSIRVFEIQQ